MADRPQTKTVTLHSPGLTGAPAGESLQESVRNWVEFALRIPDNRIRGIRLAERLTALSPQEFADALHFILEQAQKGLSDFMTILGSLNAVHEQLDARPGDYVRQVLNRAHVQQTDLLRHFLRRPPQARGLRPDFLPDPNQLANELTCGERRSLAMSRDPNTLDRLLFDPDHEVVRKLLLNSRLTLRHVLRIASRRPNRPAVLQEVSRSPRWSAIYEVKLSLARNPYTPPDLALRLLPQLHVQDLRDIADDGVLTGELRDAAVEIVFRRLKG